MKIINIITLVLLTTPLFGQNENYFNLKQDLLIPVNEDTAAVEGYYYFPSSQFGVYIDLAGINARTKKAALLLSVVRKAERRPVYIMQIPVNIDSTGRDGPTMLNQNEYQTYLINYSNTVQSIEQAKQQLQAAKTDEQKQAAQALLSSYLSMLNNLDEVRPEYEKIDKYNEVIGPKIDNGILTPTGRAWIKTLPFLNGTLNEILE